jgi:hypothetical protein
MAHPLQDGSAVQRAMRIVAALAVMGCAPEPGLEIVHVPGAESPADDKGDSGSGPLLIAGEAATPPTGVAQETPFRFAANIDRPLPEGLAVVLSLYSPSVENEWDWLDIEMVPESPTRYVLDQALADHSSQYAYRYAIVNEVSGERVAETGAIDGPITMVDKGDRTAPRVLRAFPPPDSVGVEPSETVVFSFSEVIDPDSVSAANVRVADGSDQIASVRAFQNRVEVSFTRPFRQPATLTQSDVPTTVSIHGVKDLAGNPMAAYDLSFHVRGPLLQTFAIESRKYAGNCLAVKDIKRRFADPQSWNPVIEIEDCVAKDDDLSQRWFFERAPGATGSGRIVWASNYEYCLSKRQFREPIIERCDATRARQRFTLDPYGGYHLIESDDGGCVAVGIVDVGDPNKVESSLCMSSLQRNHWSIQPREKARLAPAFMLGKYNMRHAMIQYQNPRYDVSLSVEETRELVMYLYQTRATNQAEIAEQLMLEGDSQRGSGFATRNPYHPRHDGTPAIPLPRPRSAEILGAVVENPEGYDDVEEGYHTKANGDVRYLQQEVVTRWFSDVTRGEPAAAEVCAVRFLDTQEIDYELRTFPTAASARDAGWIITHQYKCGTCSTLQDLAVYMGIPDQTTPVRLCTKRGRADTDNLDEVKQCIMESVGFTEMCAESWAYNGIHTGQECRSQCMKAYGHNALFWPRLVAFFRMVIAEKFDACPPEVSSTDPGFREAMDARGCPLANEVTGALNGCLWCDEKTSGPGFKYAAGRTRRASGLDSAIPRPNDRLYYEANHTLYFKE